MERFLKPKSPPASDFEALDDMFLGTTLPVPDLDGSIHTVTIGPYVIEAIDGHKRGVGAASVENFQYHLKLECQPPQCGVWRHYSTLPQCKEMIESYRSVIMSQNPSAFDPPGKKKRTYSRSASRRRWHVQHVYARCLVFFFVI